MPLSKKEVENFQQQLLVLKRKYQSSFEGAAQDVKTPDEAKGASQHHADEGTEDFGKTISIEIAIKGVDEIRRIDRALEKIAEGTYGICDLTGEDMPKKGLEGIPYANMTRDAQERFEKGLY